MTDTDPGGTPADAATRSNATEAGSSSATGTGSEPAPEPLPLEATTALASRIAENVESVIVGQRTTVEHLLTALLGRGHVLIDDVPGVGKTMLARSLARSIDCSFKRVQFTPDLLPADVVGVNVFDRRSRSFEFRPGPIFASVLLGDEINRAPPKTQSALLEGMEERQVTVDGETHPLPRPFVVIATQNTIDRERTYELPMAELDRFMKRIRLGYPDHDEEVEVLSRVVDRHPIEGLSPVADGEEVVRARRTVAGVTVREPLRSYATRLSAYTRERASLGVSPRGTIALVGAAQARAVLDGRGYVIPDDVQAEVRAVFPHRIAAGELEVDDLVAGALETVPVP